MDRRSTIKWVLVAGASLPLLRSGAASSSSSASRGYGSDPDLSKTYTAGELWPLALTAAQRRVAETLSDIIIPADEHSPGASAAGVVDFIDEWVSAPYPDCQRDRELVVAGLSWLDAEAERRFSRNFPDLEPAARTDLCEEICDPARAASTLQEAARFFARYRDLTAGGFYSSPIGRQDLTYMGNVPLTSFDGPPPELLKSLGLDAG